MGRTRILTIAIFGAVIRGMNELKEKLTGLGISGEMADKVIVTVAEFVKSKIPSSYHSMIDDVLAGKTPELGGILGSLGGFFGGK